VRKGAVDTSGGKRRQGRRGGFRGGAADASEVLVFEDPVAGELHLLDHGADGVEDRDAVTARAEADALATVEAESEARRRTPRVPEALEGCLAGRQVGVQGRDRLRTAAHGAVSRVLGEDDRLAGGQDRR